MKFIIDHKDFIEKSKRLNYDAEEFSFDTEPSIKEINFDIVINKLNLSTADDNKIVQIWGFCGYKEWQKFNYEPPKYKTGTLKVEDKLKEGFSYRITPDNLPMFVNVQSGWLCIGNPEKKGNAVEFINNCVAIIDGNKEFVSLWLKPERLPKI
ncbi:hypothetical protein CQ046_01650 [Chryseobacterium sp. MYb7]|uniref:hypothetical protein n=1 Tax=Chryseobacterium sp. MYb7 TaxID=1827290 RepID=UPI000D0094F3|nr:hypothetical protein [Chryseobacterium sp. MYb7]PRB06825.1 hypothetical protein CQ046_01650 [Chryseobacterium sp. MYb7]